MVGDQSSGKSSVLESLTGFAFPQAPGLCTRYATQISCKREPKTSIKVSIIPRPGCDAALAEELRTFERIIPELSSEALTGIMSEANTAMRIKMTKDDKDLSLQAFSQHILKVEISGPEQQHFTVIDVPGIFRLPQEGLTTESDVSLVLNMVQNYMENSRTIILAVLPSNVDISNQEILKLAMAADPGGTRTMGVLTKPDLVTENVNRDIIKDLVQEQRNHLRLGYFVVKNRSADDQVSTLADRIAQEKAFFAEPTWKSLAATGRCGIDALKVRLSGLLMEITKKELPNVKSDISKKLNEARKQLENLGLARNDHGSQRMYIGKLATSFQAIAQASLSGSYDSNPIFTSHPDLKLITTVTKMNERFANDFWKRGHKRHISAKPDKEDEEMFELDNIDAASTSEHIAAQYSELFDVMEVEEYECPQPLAFNDDSITKHIEQVYQANRGPDLGTVR